MAGSQCKQVNVDLDLLATLPEDFSSDEALPIGGLASDIDPDHHLAILPGDSCGENVPIGLLASVILPRYIPYVAGSTENILQPAYKNIYILRTYKNIPDPSDVVIHDEAPLSDDILVSTAFLQNILKGRRALFLSENKNSE